MVWIAETERGVKVVTYQPSAEFYIAGPFEEKDEANEWLRDRRRHRLNQVLINAVYALGLVWVIGFARVEL